MAGTATAPRKPLFLRFLDTVEWVGNRLPHPVTLFILCAGSVLLASAALSALGVGAVHPVTGQTVQVVNLLTGDGLRRMLSGLVSNFTGFVPLGTVLVAVIGVGVAEHSGLISAVLRALVLSAPRRLITAVVVFVGILSNAASDVGYVILVPMGAIIFLAFGRHPLAGLAAAFAGVSGGFSANLVLGTIDPLLSGITEQMAHIVDPTYTVTPAANYYFMFVSTFLLTILGTWVTEKIVEPRLGPYRGQAAAEELKPLSGEEKRGLRAATAATLIILAVTALTVVPEGGVLRDPATGGSLNSPFLTGIVGIMLLLFLLPGVVYGLVVKSIRNDSETAGMMAKSMSTMGSYIVLVFFAAQFVAYFSWTNIGIITAIRGAELLKGIGLSGIPLLLMFILLSGAINLVMGSASAKWAIMAPIFVPMFMLLGFTPELTQAAFRVGDSVTNIITPMMSYFALGLAFAQKYQPEIGIGSVIAMMVPYSITFLLGWSVLLVLWVVLGFPVGPGAGLFLELPHP